MKIRQNIWSSLSFSFAWIVPVLVILSALGTTAQTRETRTIESGKTLIILTSPTSIEKPNAALGTATVTPSTPLGSYSLIYVAPKVTTDTPDTVTYTHDGGDKSVLVTVTTKSQPPTLTSEGIYADSFKALFVLFIIAVVLESGLAVVFNWRPFIQFFDSRGVKTIIAFGFSFFFVSLFNMDIATRLVNLYSGSEFPVSFPGNIVTALVLAGGGSGVNNLLTALGFRSVQRREEVEPRPKPEEAWIAIKLIREKALGPVLVLIGPSGGSPTVAGTINGTSKGNRGLRYFLRDAGRFPTAGGHPVETDQDLEVKLEGVDAAGTTITSTQVWGPYRFAKGAIVDLDLTL